MEHRLDYASAPYDVVMPAALQQGVLWATSIVLAICFVLALVQSRHYKTFLPVLFLAGGACAILMEAIVCLLGHAYHPEIGQITAFKTADRSVPLHGVIMYSFYFGGTYMLLYRRVVEQSFTPSFVWKAYAVTFVFALVFEIVPVSYGLWVYYDHQALWVWQGSLPLFWTFVNSASVFGGLTLIKLFHPLLKGWKQVLVVPLVPIGVVGTHLGAGSAYYNVVNSSASPLAVNVAGAVAICFALTLVFLYSRLLSGATDPIMLGVPR